MIDVALAGARAICKCCHSVIKDRPRTCSICGDAYCHKHLHNLALVRKAGTDVVYACTTCIQDNKLEVIDPNHPLYLAFKTKP